VRGSADPRPRGSGPILVRHSRSRPDERVFGEETAHEALERFTAGLRGILEGGAAGRPLVVTHGTVMSLYLGRRLGRSAREVWDRLTMPCCVDLGREPEGSGGSPFFLSF